MSYEAIVYGYVNIENGMRYVGYHKTTEEYDGYTFSSENYVLRHAWSHGLMRKTVIYRGSVEDCMTLEHYILSKNNAVSDASWYNQSNGGGAKMYHFSHLPETAISLANSWLAGKDLQEKKVFLADKALNKKIRTQIESGYYEIHNENTEEVYHFPKNQVRFTQIDHDHVEEIRERMVSNPAKARLSVMPVIVVIDKNKNKLIVDGNHTITAAYLANWTDVPVIYINSSEFNDSQANYNDFGLRMNHNDRVKKTNSKEDCKKSILDLLDLSKENIKGHRFKTLCIDSLEEYWTEKKIVSNLAVLIKAADEREIMTKYNFKKWNKDQISKEIKRLTRGEYFGYSAVSINAGASFNAGIGGILHALYNDKNSDGVIVVHFNSVQEYLKRSSHTKECEETLKHANIPHNIVVHYLPCFIDTRTNELKSAA